MYTNFDSHATLRGAITEVLRTIVDVLHHLAVSWSRAAQHLPNSTGPKVVVWNCCALFRDALHLYTVMGQFPCSVQLPSRIRITKF